MQPTRRTRRVRSHGETFTTSAPGRYAVFVGNVGRFGHRPQALRLGDAATTTDDEVAARAQARRSAVGFESVVYLVDFEAGIAELVGGTE